MSELTENERERIMYERWKQYHFANRGFYELFERFAREVMTTHTRMGARLVFERIRWFEEVEKKANPYRVCNSFAAYYARLLMLDKPEFESLFKTKSLKSGVTNEDIFRDVIEPFRDSGGASGPKAA